MITVNELNNLISSKKPLIDSFGQVKKDQVESLVNSIKSQINYYNLQDSQIRDNKRQPADFDISKALANLENLENRVKPIETELRNMLSQAEPLLLIRDISDAGTIGGNGTVIFRTNGRQFFVPNGTLTQKDIEDKITEVTINSLKTKP